MLLLHVVAVVAACLLVAYRVYGRLLGRLLDLDAARPTPAQTQRDDLDYIPTRPALLLGQHFSAIAAAGPIVGPILAGVMFGWLPALLWIVFGSILIGGVHDLTALVASLRHRARSVAQIVREHMSGGAYVLFLLFIWIALLYIIVAFTDIVAESMVGRQVMEDGSVVLGGGVATASLLYLALPIAMGLLLRYTRIPLSVLTPVFLILVGAAIWIGPLAPLDLAQWLGWSDADARKLWNALLLVYCVVASLTPIWLLLQPRGHLGGYFLLAALAAGAVGLLLGGHTVEYPAFVGWRSASGEPLAPMLFIIVACGACSGFHAIIASGTTSKQLRRETDALAVGYGSMLLEALVAVVSLCCVMILSRAALAPIANKPNLIYAQGLASFLDVLAVPAAWGLSFGLLAFTTFVYDTLDVCTRLGRYIVQELTGWHGAAGRWVGTLLTAGVPAFFLTQTLHDASGKVVPAWRVFWTLFGASNQLLAALTLLGVTVWLWRTRRAWWVWLVTGAPTVVMYGMSVWALARMAQRGFARGLATSDPVPWVAVLLIGMAAVMLGEAVRVLWLREGARPRPPELVAAA